MSDLQSDVTETCDARQAALLESLDQKLQLVRDRVRGVAEGFSNGFYLWGEGGTSKSYSVEQVLREMQKPYKLTNSRVTGKGLFTLLRDFPDALHVLEDAEGLFADQNSFGVLRSALWGQVNKQGKQERVVCWQTGKSREEVIFTGGIIITANCPLDDVPELRAVKTRIPCLRYQPTNEEVAALMRKIARNGHEHGPLKLLPDECLEVVDAIVERSERLERNLDLRLLVNTFTDRLQWEAGSSRTHWLDLLDSRLKERFSPPTRRVGIREARKSEELELVRRIAHLPAPERLAAWEQETGKSQPALYRRLAEARGQDSHFAAAGENREAMPPATS